MTIKLRILLCVLQLELAGYGLVLLLNYQAARESMGSVREQQIGATFLGYLHKINALTGAMERNAIDLATAGEVYHALRDRVPAPQLLPDMQQHLVRNFARLPDAIGGGWWYEPFAFDPGQKYFGPYAYRDGEQIRFTWDLSTPQYDYPSQGWYRHALPADWPRTRKPPRSVVWTEPYYDEAGSMALMMTVDALMYDRDERVIGMATVDWSTEAMRAFVAAIKITPGSFSFLIDRQSGRFVSFVSDEALVMKAAVEQAWAPGVLARVRSGQLQHLLDVPWAGRPHRVYFIGTDVGLVLGLFIPEDEILLELLPMLDQSLYYGALVSITFMAAMALALAFLFRPFQRVLGQISHSLRREHGKMALTPLSYAERNEFTPIVTALNDVFSHVSEFTASLAAANEELEATHREINDLNVSLERKVVQRTEELAQKNDALQRSLLDLRDTQQQLVEAEKHAALNQLVAGVAHEVNTPVGVALTAATHLGDELARLMHEAAQGRLRYSDVERCLQTAGEVSRITVSNLERAARLVRSFKQISVDQSSEARRRFRPRAYIEDILLSLRPRLKRTAHRIEPDCPAELEVTSYPGALSQVLTNLMLNALLHGYSEGQAGTISIRVHEHERRWTLLFADDGIGIRPDALPHIFEPFFTTRPGQGGSGLGLHIVYNLVTHTLHGRIRCSSEPGKGSTFEIDMPTEV
jgi:signal transduction histidine kinase